MNRWWCTIWVCGFVLIHNSADADQSWLGVVARDFGHTVMAPLQISDHPLPVGMAAVMGALMIYRLDVRVDTHYAQPNPGGFLHVTQTMNNVGEFYDKIGSSFFVLSSAGALAVGGVLTKRSDVVQTAGLGVEAVLFTKVYSFFFKRTLSRSRPFVGEGPREFHLFSYGSSDAQRSMPSGHTSSIFAFVTVLTERHPSWWFRIPAYTFATCVAVQRMDSRSHWLSDTFFGAALGYGIGRLVVAQHPAHEGADIGLRPFVFPGGLGFGYHF